MADSTDHVPRAHGRPPGTAPGKGNAHTGATGIGGGKKSCKGLCVQEYNIQIENTYIQKNAKVGKFFPQRRTVKRKLFLCHNQATGLDLHTAL